MSSGAKKDFLILCFCNAIITTSKQDDIDAEVLSASGSYHLNKRIGRALDKLLDKMGATISSEFARDAGLASWVRQNLDKRIGYALSKASQAVVNLELMALWVLYVNFTERDKKLDAIFEPFTKAEEYLRVIDLVNQTEASKIEGEMFQLAYELIQNIKR